MKILIFLGKQLLSHPVLKLKMIPYSLTVQLLTAWKMAAYARLKTVKITIVFCPGLHLKTEMEIMKTRMKMVLISITAVVSIAREVHPPSYIVPYRTITVPAGAAAGFFVLKRRPFFKTALWLTIVRMMWAADCMLATVPALSFFIAGLQEI